MVGSYHIFTKLLNILSVQFVHDQIFGNGRDSRVGRDIICPPPDMFNFQHKKDKLIEIH